MKLQVNTFIAELKNLKATEAKYKHENEETQRNVNDEGCANAEFAAQIKELELRIK
jgi:hypothetical protein